MHLAAAAVLLLPDAAVAAEHHGRVLSNGMPLAGVTVTASQRQTKLVAVTDGQGFFQLPTIGAGEWIIHMEMQGFRAMDTTVTIPAGTPAAAVEMQMMPLAEVLAAAKPMLPNVPAPLVTATVETAAVKGKAAGRSDTAAPPPPKLAMSEPENSGDGMLINGSENNAATSKYSLAQAFGSRHAGSKRLYNGSIGLQVAGSPFNAKQYSVTGLNLAKPSQTQLTGVATLGGPMRIPHLFHNGPTFFIAYQWTRENTASTLPGLVPTIAQRNGDLSGTAVTNPATGLPNARIVQISAQTEALLALYPLPNLNGNTSYNYQTQVLNSTHMDAMETRLNKSAGRRDSFFGGFAFTDTRYDSANLFQFKDVTHTFGINTNAHWQHRFTHQLVTDISYRFSRLRTDVVPYFANSINISGNAGITGNNQDAPNWGPPTLSFSNGISELADGISAFDRNRTDAIGVSTTWTHRRHTITFGSDFRRQGFNQLQQSNPRGKFTFTGAAFGNAFADFLLGVPDASTVAFGNADKYFRQPLGDLLVVDDWRIKPELTLTASMRWDYVAPITELKGRLVNLDIAPGFTAVAPVLASNPTGSLTGSQYPTSLLRPDLRKFQPRFGFAWRPSPAQPLVIRGGYGIYIDTFVYLNAAASMSQQAPLSKSLNISSSATCPLTLANGFRDCGGSTTTASTFAIDPNFRVGYVQTWELSVQQDLPGSLVLTGTYLGSKGTHSPQEFLPNTYAPGGTPTCLSCPLGFVYRTSYANSIRNAGELQLRRRLRSGLTATLDYIFANSIDNSAFLGGGRSNSYTSAQTAYNTPSDSVAQNWRNLRAERSRSSFDQRHLLKLFAQYTTGMGISGGMLMTGWRGKLLRQWTLDSSLAVGSGLPQTPTYVATIPGTGYTNIQRASLTGADVYAAPTGYHLNAAAYAAPAAGQWGNAGRYSIEGPSSLTFDSSLARVFKLRDPYSFELRVDGFNVLNHVVYTSWVTNTNSSTFGLPTGARAMRSFQLSGRLRF